MSDDVLHVGIIGCGRIAGAIAPAAGRRVTHAQAIGAHDSFHLAAVSDPSPERAAAFVARWGGEIVDDLGALGLDVVAVCTPDATHVDTVIGLLNGAKPPRLIVVEKPVCLNPAQAETLRTAAAQSQTAIVVNHTRRFDAGHLAVRDVVADGRLGPVLGVRWTHYGGWMHNGVHLVDALRLILGDEIVPVRVERGWEDRVGDPCIEGLFRCDRHPLARILVESFPETAFQLFEGEIRLQDGRIRLMDFGDDIWLDEVVVNAAGERELKATRRLAHAAGPTPMENLYDLVARHLDGGDDDVVRRAGLCQALATMHTLFDTVTRLSP
jgi:predicted dehydrogenase